MASPSVIERSGVAVATENTEIEEKAFLDQASIFFRSGYELARSATAAVIDAARRTSDTASAIREIITHLLGNDGKVSSEERKSVADGFFAILNEFWEFLPPHVSRTHFMYWLIRYSMRESSRSLPENKHDPVTIEQLQRLRHYVRYCSASYGKLAVGFMSRSVSTMIADKEEHKFANFVSKYTGVREEDVVHVESKGGLHRPVHYVVVDRARQKVVVVVRGSMTVSDLWTDLNCKPDTFIFHRKSYHVHSGMLQSARELDSEIRPLVLSLLEENKGFTTVVVGHSLGAGVGALLTAIWCSEQRGDLSETTCYAFGTPCVASYDLCKELHPIVTTVVVGDDFIPRLSLASMHYLRRKVVATFDQESGRGAAEKDENIDGEQIPPAPRYEAPDPPKNYAPKRKNSLLPRLPPHQKRRNFGPRPSVPENSDDPNYPRLFPPGRILWVPAKDHSGAANGHAVRRMRSVPVEDFDEIVLSSSMFLSHLPLRYESAVAEAEYCGLVCTAMFTYEPLQREGKALDVKDSPSSLPLKKDVNRVADKEDSMPEEIHLLPGGSKLEHDQSDECAPAQALAKDQASPRLVQRGPSAESLPAEDATVDTEGFEMIDSNIEITRL